MSVYKPTIREQVKYMSHPYLWGTHPEMKAVATLSISNLLLYTNRTQWCIQQECYYANLNKEHEVPNSY